jgi:hypothetical protein
VLFWCSVGPDVAAATAVSACAPCLHRELALESGVEKWGRVPALNTNARFIEDLADAVVSGAGDIQCCQQQQQGQH